MQILGLAVLSYLIGSLPFGVWIAKAKGIDIFAIGSGNPGATNIKRALGLGYGLLVFALDVLKGALPAIIGRSFVTQPVGPVDPQVIWFGLGCCAVAGHCLSPFLGFRGGKGISTALGAGLGAAPLVALAAFGVFLVLMAATRFVSLSSIVAVPTTLLWANLIPGQSRQLLPVYAVLSIFILYRHRSNIGRLRAGTESRFELRSKAAEG